MNQDLIAAVADMDFTSYHAKRVHAGLQGLMKLSKAAALAEIETYLARHPEAQSSIGLFILIRSLFELPEGTALPTLRLGKPSLDPPVDAASLPSFPCIVVADVPFLIVSGYALGGLPETVGDHLSHYQKAGSIRKSLMDYPDSWAMVEVEFRRQWAVAYGSELSESMVERVKRQF